MVCVVTEAEALRDLVIQTYPVDCREDLAGMLAASGAVHRGHFLLKSGRHSDTFVQFAAVAKEPQNVVRIAGWLADFFKDATIDCVVVPSTAAAVLGYEVALNRGSALSLVTQDAAGYPYAFSEGFEVPAGMRVLLVNDVVTTGATLQRLDSVCVDAGLEVAGVAVFASRGAKVHELQLSCPQESRVCAIELAMQDIAAEVCPQCDKGESIRSFWDYTY